MKFRLKFLILFAAFINLFIACKNNKTNKTIVEKSFYYWKSNGYWLSNSELDQLKDLHIQKLYIKFFEVEPDPIFMAKPFAKSQLEIRNYTGRCQTEQDSLLCSTISNLKIIPTIYIKNNVFNNTSGKNLDTLADNIIFLINKYYKKNINNSSADYKEIQIDCDWTQKTKDNYFYLLSAIKKLSKKIISCTLRLYPYKYPDVMGLPPVDKATLMCYNLINPLGNENKNSILNINELESYFLKVAN